MLQLNNGSIVETLGNVGMQDAASQANSIKANAQFGRTTIGGFVSDSCTIGGLNSHSYPYQTQWYSYPVYVCTDKTAKAIEILKSLQADKILEVKSVPKFIELVEKISSIL